MGIETDNDKFGAFSFAEARGQKVVEEIVLKKLAKVREDLNGKRQADSSKDPEVSDEEKKIVFDPGTCSI